MRDKLNLIALLLVSCFSFTICRKDVMFGLGVRYGEGSRPSVALSGDTLVISVFEASRNRLFYKLGNITGLSIVWGQEIEVGKGTMPDVAANGKGQLVLVYQDTDDKSGRNASSRADANYSLVYRTGTVSGTSIIWSEPEKFAFGAEPTVALANDGSIVEVHRAGMTDIVYRTGRLDKQAILFGPATTFASGRRPDVSLNNNGDLVVAYCNKNKSYSEAYYSTAKLAVTGRIEIRLSAPVLFATEKASHPSVTINDDGFIVLLHKVGVDSDKKSDDLFSQSGTLDPQTRLVDFGKAVKFDSGRDTSTASNNRLAVQVHSAEKNGLLWYTVSYLVDRTRWMEHTPALQERSLLEITLPATHDSGTYNLLEDRAHGCSGASGIPGMLLESISGKLTRKLGKTQNHNLLEQLEGGVRFMDIRPYYWKGKFYAFHDNINSDNMESMLKQIRDFLKSTNKELLLLTITHFCSSNFNSNVHKLLISQIKEILGDYLYKASSADKVVKTKLKDFVSSGSRVLLMYADAFGKEFGSAQGFWPMLNITGKYSNTEDVQEMMKKQLQKLSDSQAIGHQLNRLYFTLTFNPLKTSKFSDLAKSLHKITKPASLNLSPFLAKLDRKWKINLLYVDYYEEARATDNAIWLNSLH